MQNDGVLQRFMEEFFPFDQFKEIGFFKEEISNDFEAQAERVCTFFGYNTVYEYGAKSFRCHITYAVPDDPFKTDPDAPFITEFKSIYES